MSAFATVDDYIARYGEVEDANKLECLLLDASNYLKALYFSEYGEEYKQDERILFDLNAAAVTCAIVARMLNVPSGMEGVSQTSQSADVYSASYTFANPTGDFYLTKSDKERLGIGAGVISSIKPLTDKDRRAFEEEQRKKHEEEQTDGAEEDVTPDVNISEGA